MTMFIAGLVMPIANAAVKVRSYDRGKKIESDIGKSKGLDKRKRGSGSNSFGGSGSVGREGRPAPEDDFEQGELLLANPPIRLEQGLAEMGMKVIERVQLKNLKFSYLRIRTPKKMSVRKAVDRLSSRYPGATVAANHRYDLSAAKSLGRMFPRKAVSWGPVNARCGEGLRIGLIDGAVDTDHPALKGQKVTYRSFHQRKRNPAPTGHGTSIASMFVGKIMRNGWSGLVPGAELYAASMFETDRRDQMVGTSTGMLQAIDWLFEKKVHVVNMSIAGADNEVLKKAIEIARKKKMVLVAAVGNWAFRGEPVYPAAYPEVISVTAVAGPRHKPYPMANQGKYVDFSAPGANMWIPSKRLGNAFSGTSFAAPYVSVIIASQVAQMDGPPDTGILRNSVRRSVIDLGKRGRDNIFGYGMIREGPSCGTKTAEVSQIDKDTNARTEATRK